MSVYTVYMAYRVFQLQLTIVEHFDAVAYK